MSKNPLSIGIKVCCSNCRQVWEVATEQELPNHRCEDYDQDTQPYPEDIHWRVLISAGKLSMIWKKEHSILDKITNKFLPIVSEIEK